MKTMTWTIRLAIASAAMLALMAPAASARPAAPIVPAASATAPAAAVTLAPDRVDGIGTARQPVAPVSTVVVRSTGNGFDWSSAAIGAGSVLALVLIASAGVVARGRRRVPLSA
jgi:hypothetical protein